MLFLMSSSIPLPFLVTRTLLAHEFLLSTRTLRSLYAELLSRRLPQAVLGAGLCICLWSVLGSSFLLIFQPAEILLRGCTALWSIGHSSQLCVVTELEDASSPSSRSFINKLNNAGPSTEPLGTPLVTGLKLDPVSMIMTLSDIPQSTSLSAHLTPTYWVVQDAVRDSVKSNIIIIILLCWNLRTHLNCTFCFGTCLRRLDRIQKI